MENIIIKKEEYSKACKEVLEIFKSIKQEDLDKIPNYEIERLKQNADNDYKFSYDSQKNEKEQNISKLAKAIIANFFIDYIASHNQKQKILVKQKYDMQLIEQQKLKEHNVNDIFKNEKKNNQTNNKSSILPIEVKKEILFKRIINFIKNILKI